MVTVLAHPVFAQPQYSPASGGRERDKRGAGKRAETPHLLGLAEQRNSFAPFPRRNSRHVLQPCQANADTQHNNKGNSFHPLPSHAERGEKNQVPKGKSVEPVSTQDVHSWLETRGISTQEKFIFILKLLKRSVPDRYPPFLYLVTLLLLL